MYVAAEAGDVDKVRQLCNARANLGWTTFDGDIALASAAENGHFAVVKILLESKANTDAKTCDSYRCGRTDNRALHYAATEGRVEIVKLLVEHRADMEANNRNGETPLCIATRRSDINVVKQLVECKANIESIYYISGLPNYGANADVAKFLREAVVTVVITCEHVVDGSAVKCSNVSGEEILSCSVPAGEGPYGQWLVSEVSEVVKQINTKLLLIDTDGNILWKDNVAQSF